MTTRKKLKKGASVLIVLLLLCCLARPGLSAHADRKSYTLSEAEMLARLIWGEARGCDQTQQAAVAWCVLNRVDSALFPNTISGVITQPRQFAGYRAANPVDPQILALVYDVLSRWSIEDCCVGTVGRVLPKEYLFFGGDGTDNQFRVAYHDKKVWDWSIPSPYGTVSDKIQAEPSIVTQADSGDALYVYYPASFQGEI